MRKSSSAAEERVGLGRPRVDKTHLELRGWGGINNEMPGVSQPLLLINPLPLDPTVFVARFPTLIYWAFAI